MVRTIVSLDEDDKAWLDRRAREEDVSMTELVRRAVRLLRARIEAREPPLVQLLQQTRGIWREGDGLEYQRRVRGEWDR